MIIAAFTMTLSSKCVVKKDLKTTIYDQFAGDTKTLFKVWHLLNEKTYDYNTEQGIKKYITFKKNLKIINEHNLTDSSYKKGLNHLTDMTEEEVKEFYGLKPITLNDIKNNLRSLRAVSLDDFNEDEEELMPINAPVRGDVSEHIHVPVNHLDNMRPIRNQGQCGSCWAYTTLAVMEGSYNKQYDPDLTDWWSTQQSVDCDAGNGGCNGGWFYNAFNFYKSNDFIPDAAYSYKGAKGPTCRNKETGMKHSKVKVASFDYCYSCQGSATNQAKFNTMLQAGPMGVAVDANAHWFSYSNGILDCACSSGINHAVTCIGYGETAEDECNKGGKYFIVRNSWGTGWGEQGYVRVAHKDTNSNSCNIENYAFGNVKFKTG